MILVVQPTHSYYAVDINVENIEMIFGAINKFNI